MKICAIICEFNPFHNGHKYLLDKAKNISGCDAVLCIMSGNFTQRGEMCVLDKYTRAKHAVLGGSDCVIQLPLPFAVAPAEIFAKGAIKILSAIPDVTALAFGCESGNAENFIKASELLIDESERFKNVLNKKLADGDSYIKSYAAAFEDCGGDKSLISNPNNVLGLEYVKAILRAKAAIKILPIKRIGSGYNDGELKENYSSASAIRQNLACDTIRNNLPDFVYENLKNFADSKEFESMLRHYLFKTTAKDLKRIYGCGEGLENKLKSLENQPLDKIICGATSKRYSSSRIRRILCANALEIYREDTERFLKADLYIKPIAVKKERADEILSALAKSVYPVITGAYNDNLTGSAGECFKKDCFENSLYLHVTCSQNKDYMILV